MNPIRILNRSLNSELAQERNTLSYEFNRVIGEFKTQEIKKEYTQHTTKRVREVNEKYDKTVNKLKEAREDYILYERDKELKEIHKKWEEEAKKRAKIKEDNNVKMQLFNEMNMKTKQHFTFQKKKLKENINKLEQQRLIAEARVLSNLDKMNKTSKQNMENFKVKFEEKLSHSLVKFKANHEEAIIEKEAEMKIRQEKPILRYEDWFINHVQEVKKQKEIKKQDKEKRMQKMEDIADELIQELEEKGKKVIAKIRTMEKKKNEVKKSIADMYHSKSELEMEKYHNLIKKQEEFKKKKDKDNNKLLEKHLQYLTRAKSIENFGIKNKSNLIEKNVLFQQDSVRSIMEFYKDLDVAKSESIYKKSPEQRRKIYLTLKRKEEMERKRLEEESQKKKE